MPTKKIQHKVIPYARARFYPIGQCRIVHMYEWHTLVLDNLSSKGSKQWGNLSLSHNRWANGNAAEANFSVGGSNPGRPIVGGGGGAVFTRSGFELPTEKTPVNSITIRPLLGLRRMVSPLLGAASDMTKTQVVCFCLTNF